jgi:septal ring factor EnvC (AmiA/AmiB activator)
VVLLAALACAFALARGGCVALSEQQAAAVVTVGDELAGMRADLAEAQAEIRELRHAVRDLTAELAALRAWAMQTAASELGPDD